MLHRLERCLSDEGELAIIAGGVIASSAGEGKTAVDFLSSFYFQLLYYFFPLLGAAWFFASCLVRRNTTE